MSETRRFDSLERTVRDTRRALEDARGTVLARLGSHTHPGGGGGGTAPDATTTAKGILQLAGDLAGTAALPTVPGLAGKAATGHTHAATPDATTTVKGVLQLAGDLAGTAALPTVPGLANKSDTSHTHPGGGSPDATTTVKGILKLAGDLAGTADLPTVPELANKQPLDSDLTAIAALAPADGTFIKRITGAWNASTLVKGDVGLGSVDNTTDAAKPVSTATQTALNAKAPTNLASVQAYIATAQTTTSLTYVDLTTVGPACVLVLASARRVLIFLKAILFQTSTANRVFMSVAASGATVAAAGDAAAVIHNGSGQAESYAGIVYLDCLAGTTTFTAKYRVAGTTGSFQDRFMVVIPV